MKALTAKSGMIITLLLVIALMVYGVRSSKTNISPDTAVEFRAGKPDQLESKLNLRGVTRHLLDFYK